ncbi:NYN domain-containing protein [Coniochaeta sp. 2T2.1]|nr:NYN domain-containing protein [Coniochaeta sp. 2T2.1]
MVTTGEPSLAGTVEEKAVGTTRASRLKLASAPVMAGGESGYTKTFKRRERPKQCYNCQEIANHRRAYGDWTGTSLKGWKDQLLTQSIQPVQPFTYTHGKNATDSAMIIDAMDLLYTNRFDGFCLVSSDSDFTRLAARIRESGLVVYVFGERKTPKPFVSACDKFIYFDNILYNEHLGMAQGGAAGPALYKQIASAVLVADSKLQKQLRTAVEAASEEEGWANLAKVGTLITKQYPDFDPRTFGYPKLSDLVIATSLFDIERRSPGKGKSIVMYARDKRSGHPVGH